MMLIQLMNTFQPLSEGVQSAIPMIEALLLSVFITGQMFGQIVSFCVTIGVVKVLRDFLLTYLLLSVD